jgi:cellulose biosynthesis protein BcsQ
MRTTVMEGSLSDFDLASVIQVVSIGRQYTSIELLDEQGEVVGTLFIKSGKILAANTGSASGFEAISSLFRGERHTRFSVYRTEPFDDVASPVGSVGEILLRLTAAANDPEDPILVMRGTLSEFDLISVLQVIGLGRQYTALDLTDPQGDALGRIELKAGKVVSATSGHLTGVDALRRLARAPSDSVFVVYRLRTSLADHHLGGLGQILVQLSEPDEGWGPVEENTRARDLVPAVVAPVSPAAPPTAPKMDAREPPPYEEPQHVPFSPFRETPTAARGMKSVAATSEVPVIALSGPKGGAGKTTVAINLAVALARQGKRVTIVDADANGVLLALNAVERGPLGAYDVLAGKALLNDIAMKTRIAGLRIVPAGDLSSADRTSAGGWSQLLRDARSESDVVLVDTGSGLQTPAFVLGACSHVLVVMPAEPTAVRALPGYLKRLEAAGQPPSKVLGIVLNMLDYRARVSIEVLRDLCGGASGPWVFDVPIARSPAFMEAVARGVPVCRSERTGTPTIGWVFEMLAGEILERLGLASVAFDDSLLA